MGSSERLKRFTGAARHGGQKWGGFTLIEALAVLAIIAILAAVALPSLTGFVSKADEVEIEQNLSICAKTIQTWASERYGDGVIGQDALVYPDEEYAENPDASDSFPVPPTAYKSASSSSAITWFGIVAEYSNLTLAYPPWSITEVEFDDKNMLTHFWLSRNDLGQSLEYRAGGGGADAGDNEGGSWGSGGINGGVFGGGDGGSSSSVGGEGNSDDPGDGGAPQEPPPNQPPVITLNGQSVISLLLGEEFSDPGAEAFDDRDGDLTEQIVVSGSVDTGSTGRYELTYTVSDSAGLAASKTRIVIVIVAESSKDYGYTGGVQTFTAPRNGLYQLECWGAGAAPVNNAKSGKGAYTSGEIWLQAGETVYIYVGGNTAAFNGSAKSGRGHFSGGATDIRLVNAAWNDVVSLRSRIMVAGGGGTYGAASNAGGAAGGLSGSNGAGSYGSGSVGGTQTAGGANNGGFGTGGFGTAASSGYGGAGGGGYYGGGGVTPDGSGDDDKGGGGGSSYVSGFAGCNSVKWSTIGTQSGSANHYSGKIFQNARMTAGNAAMPNTAGVGTMTGNAGAGHARISLIEPDATDILLVEAQEAYINPATPYFKTDLDLGTTYLEPGYFAWDPIDGVVTDKVVVEGADFDVFALGEYDVTYSYTNSEGQTTTAVRRVAVSPVREEFAYTGDVQTFTAFAEGTYKIELWGAGAAPASGKGAYTSGEITLQKGDVLYLYVGGNASAFGGSAASGRAGVRSGGATDVRLVSGAWNDPDGLRSRIMVAGGGGSYGAVSNAGGHAGGLSGSNGAGSYGSGSVGGTQTAAGANNGGFGTGGFGTAASSGFGGGGGGGYYGGGGVTPDGSGDDDKGGGGGSSYISGFIGCNSVTSLTDGRHTGSVNHYSGLVFKNGLMIAGNATMEDPTLPFTMVGNARAGHARIGLVDKPETQIELKGSVDMSIDIGTPYVEAGYSATDYYDGNVTSEVLVTGDDFDVFQLGTYVIEYRYTNTQGHTFSATRKVTVRPVTQDFAYTGDVQTFTAPSSGFYRVELWGSASAPVSGRGAYTKGEIFLTAGQKLQVYVGGNASAFGGGAASGRAGVRSGGATDVRLVGGAWNDPDGLRSRIMVAGGGGSYGAVSNAGGAAGGLSGAGGAGSYGGGGVGGTQTAGGANNGGFGTGGFGTAGGGGFGGAGGGGYYGGGGAGTDGSGDDDRGGGGGSSFISGFAGCNAVMDYDNANHSGSPAHYSGLVFSNASMVAGNASMPDPTGPFNMTGRAGTGYARFSLFDKSETQIALNGDTTLGLDIGTAYVEQGYTATDYYDGDLTDKVLVTSDINPLVPGLYTVRYTVTNSNGTTAEAVRYLRYRSPKPSTYEYTGAPVAYEVLHDGRYRLELWGASSSPASGLGAYTKGEIHLTRGTILYLYVGGNASAFGGGAASGRAGVRSGGATDVRLVSGAWNDPDGLRSRIMVAGGGGSYGAVRNAGGAAGGLSGAGGAGSYGGGGVGGTQTAGGANNGGFGTGGFGTAGGGGFGGAGGGGYYGGGGAGTDGSGDDDRGGGGGSSFISGFIGCNAVISQTNGVLSGQPNHYSGLVFTNTQMAAGNASMPNHNGLGSRTGNSGTGFAKITLLVCDSVD